MVRRMGTVLGPPDSEATTVEFKAATMIDGQSVSRRAHSERNFGHCQNFTQRQNSTTVWQYCLQQRSNSVPVPNHQLLSGAFYLIMLEYICLAF